MRDLPMYDPHELIEYAWQTGHWRVSDEDIELLGGIVSDPPNPESQARHSPKKPKP